MREHTRILVIEDNDDVREMLRELLEYAGYEVIEAADGPAGISLYRIARADLIITDLLMPQMSGLDAILEVRRDYPDAKIIAISGGGRQDEDGILSLARRFGASRTLQKPFRLQEMLEAVQQVLHQPA